MALKKTISSLVGRFALSDEEAMRRSQVRNDREAYALLVERWGGRIRQLCFRMQGNAATAEDLAQETFARIYANRHRFKAGASFATYVRKVALNLCYDELRRRHRAPTDPLELADSSEATRLSLVEETSPDVNAVQEEEGEMVRRALGKLAPIYRSVVVLRHYEGLKLREVAALLEIPEGTVNSRL